MQDRRPSERKKLARTRHGPLALNRAGCAIEATTIPIGIGLASPHVPAARCARRILGWRLPPADTPERLPAALRPHSERGGLPIAATGTGRHHTGRATGRPGQTGPKEGPDAAGSSLARRFEASSVFRCSGRLNVRTRSTRCRCHAPPGLAVLLPRVPGGVALRNLRAAWATVGQLPAPHPPRYRLRP